MSEKNKEKEKFKFVFPNKLAKKMGRVSMRVQMEAGMLSQALLLLGLTFMVIFMAITQPNSLIYTIAVIFNLICGWILIGSYLVTTYQQYVNHLEIMGIDPDKEREAIRAQGNIFKRIFNALRRRRGRGRNKENYTEEDLQKIHLHDEFKETKKLLKMQKKAKNWINANPYKLKQMNRTRIKNRNRIKMSKKSKIDKEIEDAIENQRRFIEGGATSNW